MTLSVFSDEHFMKEAFKEAKLAFDEDEVPIGAVIVCNNKIIARGHNQTERLNDVTAHAEMIALTSAANYLGAKYMTDCDLYVTIEPCVMCAGAIYWGQFRRLIFGARDVKQGFMKHEASLLHPKTNITYGVMEAECGKLMTDFFNKLRN